VCACGYEAARVKNQPKQIDTEIRKGEIPKGQKDEARYEGASGAPLRSSDERAHVRLKAEPYNSETLYTDKESEVEQKQTRVKAAQSTMESQSDTVDEVERVSRDKDKSKDKDKEVMSCHVMSPRPAAQSTMESQSDTVDEGEWEAPISSDKDKSKDKDNEVMSCHVMSPIGMCDAHFANAGEIADPQSNNSSSNSRKQEDQQAENKRAANKPKVDEAQEGDGSAIGKMAPNIFQINFEKMKKGLKEMLDIYLKPQISHSKRR